MADSLLEGVICMLALRSVSAIAIIITSCYFLHHAETTHTHAANVDVAAAAAARAAAAAEPALTSCQTGGAGAELQGGFLGPAGEPFCQFAVWQAESSVYWCAIWPDPMGPNSMAQQGLNNKLR